MSALERREVLYSGQVQGVGFRYSTASLSRRFSVTGFVRNLADGRVQLVVEGDGAQIDALLAAIDDRLGPYIRERSSCSSPVRDEFTAFEIRY